MGKRKQRISSSAKAGEDSSLLVEPRAAKITREDDNGGNGEVVELLDDDEPGPSTTPTQTEIIGKLQKLMSSTKLVLVQGLSGCGKTYCAHQISAQMQMPLHIFHINDQCDSKVIYGSYNCTEVPGEFNWTFTKFSQNLQQKCLVLLENIDHGGADLCASLMNLAENGSCDLPNGKRVVMHADCRLLATVSLDEQQADCSRAPLLLREYPFSVNMPAMGLADFQFIIAKATTTATALTTEMRAFCANKLVQLFSLVSALINEQRSSIDRTMNSKDLFRAVKRLNNGGGGTGDGKAKAALFLELFDLWAAHLTNSGLQSAVAAAIGEALSLAPEEQEYLLSVRQPEIVRQGGEGEQQVQFGRTRLAINNNTRGDSDFLAHSTSAASNFVNTRDSAKLLEFIATGLGQCPPEPVLLTGDTGVGKTSAVQQMARLLKSPLHVINLSQDSEFTDLIGGYKPTVLTNIFQTLADDYIQLFKAKFDETRYANFLKNLNDCLKSRRFDFLLLIINSSLHAIRKHAEDKDQWTDMVARARRLLKCIGRRGGEGDDKWHGRLVFEYVKGVVSQAAEQGHWLLVDEINLASAECLDAIVELLDGTNENVHPDFRLFACMNHATDIGKRPLPSGIRSNFTEYFVTETRDPEQLRTLIRGQLPSLSGELVEATMQFYTGISTHFPKKFSLRNLSRALWIAKDQQYSSQKNCLISGLSISFSSQLGILEREKMSSMLKVFGRAELPAIDTSRVDTANFVLVEGSKIRRGKQLICAEDDSYIFTPSVRSNMTLLARIVSTGKYPILMEGETSAGKTSLIVQLARMTGNRIYRIQQHEHTDIQEYIGTYAPNADGKLEFVEGILLKAVRNGDWVILDELNLAPSPVLESLNRLLDDNRELYVPQLNRTVRAHPHFQLFATQNPVGLYAGRKRLSRAFIGRFLVIQFDCLPSNELPQIVYRRCGIALSQAELMVSVLEELKMKRTISEIFASIDGLMTLRDLFRWANRLALLSQPNDDWRQSLADQGYFVLAARCRKRSDEEAIVEVLEKKTKRTIDRDRLFGPESVYLPMMGIPDEIVPTQQLRRMLVLLNTAWRCNEPVLLVGETGCGKTTAAHLFDSLLSINCHERTDAADLLGSIRPSSGGGGFRWQDGVVLQAMRQGRKLLIDEISLAADSVLERLNSIFEPQRTILLTDAGVATQDNSSECTVTAHPDFQLVATMNPGNDYGKKELSKALRNRFTEIWCSQSQKKDDLAEIMRRRLTAFDNKGQNILNEKTTNIVVQLILSFAESFQTQFSGIMRIDLSTRDYVTMVSLFMEFYTKAGKNISIIDAIFHSIEANLLDSIGILSSSAGGGIDRAKIYEDCVKMFETLVSQMDPNFRHDFCPNSEKQQLRLSDTALSIGPFSIARAHDMVEPTLPRGFSLDSPTTRRNLLRVIRALHSSKPVMLEGSPGAGKSSLVMALAAATGHKLTRLNLSEQTDLYDLFGSDIPVVDQQSSAITFAWCDGPVLRAIKEGSWILLDEMNLASQSVLEGLNSCFDFRNRIYIAELNKTFDVDMGKCKFFACQNPHSQGGDRRALPKSFLNRFISIFVEEMSDDDFIYILCEFYKNANIEGRDNNSMAFSEDLISKMVLVNKLCRELVRGKDKDIGWSLHNGGPFEFNLRDLFRWADAICKFQGNVNFAFDLIYLSRLRSKAAKDKVILEIFNPVFSGQKWAPSLPLVDWNNETETFSIGNVQLTTGTDGGGKDAVIKTRKNNLCLMATQHELLEKLAACATANWLVILTGPSHIGKSSAVGTLASLTGQTLAKIRLTPETDALDLLGSFEQIVTEDQNDDKEGERMDSDEAEENSSNRNNSRNLRFQWMDSQFLRAFRDGHWLLVEDVNCCNLAVLDCLNSCLESPEGQLVLPLDNMRTVSRHPNFRIFFTMNPKNGQLSRAMRNRAVELAFCCNDDNDGHNLVDNNAGQLWSSNLLDLITFAFGNQQQPLSVNVTSSGTTLQAVQRLTSLLVSATSISPQNVLSASAMLQSDHRHQKYISNEAEFQRQIELLTDFIGNDCPPTSRFEQPELVLGIVQFPPVTRLNSRFSYPDLLIYYWRIWDELSSVHDKLICCQLNLFFPQEIDLERIQNNFQLGKKFLYKSSKEKKKALCLVTNFKQHLHKGQEEKREEKSMADDLDDHLLGPTFPEMQIASMKWKQVRGGAANETEWGRRYIAEVNARSGCRRFKNNTELNSCINVDSEGANDEKMQIDVEQEEEDSASMEFEKNVFVDLGHNLRKTIHLLQLAFANDNNVENNSAATLRLRWKDDESRRAFSFSQTMSFHCGQLFSAGQLNEEQQKQQIVPMIFFSYLKCSFLVHSVNICLWSRLNYGNNILYTLRVGQLSNASTALESIVEMFWNLKFACKGGGLDGAICNAMGNVQEKIGINITNSTTNYSSGISWLNIVDDLLSALELLSPPQGLVDPPYFNGLRRKYWQERLAKLDTYFAAIQQFLLITIATNYDFDQICHSSPFTRFPFLQLLSVARLSTISALEKIKEMETESEWDDHKIVGGDGEDGRIYRAFWREGEEAAYERNFQELVRSLRECTEQVNALSIPNLFSISKPNESGQKVESTLLKCAQLKNAVDCIDVLKTRLTHGSSNDDVHVRQQQHGLPPPILLYPDILTPYLTLLDILAIALSELHLSQQNLVTQGIQEKHHFTEEHQSSFKQIFADNDAEQIDDGRVSLALTEWALSEFSHFSSEQKLSFCLWRNCSTKMDSQRKKLCLEWLFGEWNRWFEQNAKQQKEQSLFVYRTRRKSKEGVDAGENDRQEDILMEEDEQQQFLAIFPSFKHSVQFNDVEHESSATINGGQEEEEHHLTGDQLYDAVDRVLHANNNARDTGEDCRLLPFLPLMQIYEQMGLDNNSTVGGRNGDKIIAYQLVEVAKLRRELYCADELEKNSNPDSVNSLKNVYKETDLSALVHCLHFMELLIAKCKELIAEFPENAQLLQILKTAHKFMHKVPAGAPLMNHAAHLERILELAEQWENIADRAHSLRHQLIPLQEVLVQWRRREVLCWSALLKHVQKDLTQLALLVGWPLFKVALDIIARVDGVEERKLLLMFLDWLQNSTLGDWEARLFSGRLLSQFLLISDQPQLSARINSIVAHFEQFSRPIKDRFAGQYNCIEKELKEFTRVVSYTDLNLWTIKDSARRAHIQLFRIIKKYKELCNEPLSPILLDELPKMPDFSSIEFVNSSLRQINFSDLLSSSNSHILSTIHSKIDRAYSDILCIDILSPLLEGAADLLQLMRTQVQYKEAKSGDNCEEINTGNEKIKGRALFVRQQRFAQIVRMASAIGLISRRALNLDSEALTFSTLVDIPALTSFSEKLNEQIRHSVAARNVFLRHFASLNHTQQPHLTNQISDSQLKHLSGINEFALHWLFNAVCGLANQAMHEGKRLETISRCFETELENSQEQRSFFSHRQMSDKFTRICTESDAISATFRQMQQILSCCPKRSEKTQIDDPSFPSSLRFLQQPLGSLRKGSAEYTNLNGQLVALGQLLQQIQTANDEEKLHLLRISENVKELFIWKRSRWLAYEKKIVTYVEKIRTLICDTEISHYFPQESQKICDNLSCIEQQQQIEESTIEQPSLMPDSAVNSPAQDTLLDQFNYICKKIEQIIMGSEQQQQQRNSAHSIDKAKEFIEYIGRVDMQKVNTQLVDLFISISSSPVHSLADCLNKDFVLLLKGVCVEFSRLLKHLTEFICHLAGFHANWVAIGCHLLTKGFVNQIPKAEQKIGENDGKEKIESGCGFGEGDLMNDATDVTGEVEAMEQIEGLKEKGPQSEQEEGQQDGEDGQKEMGETEQPIDVDQDFAANLEGLDDCEEDNEQNEDNENGEEQAEDYQAEWNFGDVEEPDDVQNDRLWETNEGEEEQQERRKDEEGREGADKLTGKKDSAQEDATTKQGEENAEPENGQTEQSLSPEGDDKSDIEDDGDRNKGDDGEDLSSKLENLGDIGGDEEEQNIDENGDEQADDCQPAAEDDNVEEPAEKEDAQTNEQTSEDIQNNDRERRQEGKGMGKGGAGEMEYVQEDDMAKEQTQKEEEENLQSESGRKDQLSSKNEEMVHDGDENDPIIQDLNTNRMDLGQETGDSSQLNQEFFAHASSTLEHAQRTKKLFEQSLRRMRKFASDLEKVNNNQRHEDNNNVEKQQFDHVEHSEKELMELDKQPEIDKKSEEKQNALGEESNFVFTIPDMLANQNPPVSDDNNADYLCVEKLCSDFELLEEQQHQAHAEREYSADERENRVDDSDLNRQTLQRKWALVTRSMAPLAAELTESLRTIIEPTIASRLQGDYRSGKRLNMRRLITYIASDYRKDRIWMRRTKRAKRNYQVCIAVDNSESMQHNRMSEITCNSVCLIERALRQLEIGQLAVLSFGSRVSVISDFSSNEDPEIGVRVLNELKFDQKRTNLAQLLSHSSALFNTARERNNLPVEQILIILGDGRGVLNEGTEQIQKALNQLNSARVTVLFLIMDTAEKSVTEMRVADFTADGRCTFHPYMQSFPFRLYALVRSTHYLPRIMTEAVRQWFEFTTRS